MLLSRVAESVYWAGRYLERAEATARLVQVHTELFLDLPKAAGIGWTPLLARHRERRGVPRPPPRGQPRSEVVDFLAADAEQPPARSIDPSMRPRARRATSRVDPGTAVLPIEAWEVLNELHLWAGQTCHRAVDRRTRLAWTNQVIRQCQLLSGLLDGTMSHDEAYSFLEIGRGLERADMTTRVLDVQAGILLGQRDRADALRRPHVDERAALARAHQMFRRTVGSSVSGPAALQFLLRDPQLPRSVEHCLIEISRRCSSWPAPGADGRVRGDPANARAHRPRCPEGEGPTATALHEYSNRLQDGFAALHDQLVATYFQMKPSTSTVRLLLGR